ncbi:MAG: hypothetical protein QOJ70_624 [Acidobacteriota bacterium]|jgi:hypothetical protein|nr:hypothetical protein [Acidobacteriota bacterium]MDT7806811.1 hypothetical protein [Acidobacteriota bacterium]
MGLRNLFKRKKTDDEAERRTTLLRAGRITEGSIFDVITDEAGAITHVFYNYQISGVEYESSQLLDTEQRRHTDDYFPGARVTVRFNPRQPGNSVVV